MGNASANVVNKVYFPLIFKILNVSGFIPCKLKGLEIITFFSKLYLVVVSIPLLITIIVLFKILVVVDLEATTIPTE